jgi:hypothetical protein
MENQDTSVSGIVTGPGVEAKYKDQIDALRAQHKRIRFWEIEGHGLFVIRKPKRLDLQNYRTQLDIDGFDRTTALENYVRAVAVVPESADLVTAVFEDWPVFSGVVNAALQELGGGVVRDLGKA